MHTKFFPMFQMVRRQRVDFMSGQHQLAHFFKGKDTPTTDVLQVGCYTYITAHGHLIMHETP